MSNILEYSRFRFDLVFTQGATLPYWMGSTFRGGIGQHLSSSVCLGLNCPYCKGAPCLFRDVYLPRRAKRGHAQPSKPVIIIPPFFARKIDLPAGGKLSVDVIMLGVYTKTFLQLLLGMIAFGQGGIGPDRHYGGNRFEVISVKCLESGRYVMKDGMINSDNFMTKDIKDIPPLGGNQIILSFKTPFTGPFMPTTTKSIIRLIRHRLILMVNEYGTGEFIPDVDATGEIEVREVRRHKLRRRSSRSEKEFFTGWTGSFSMTLSSFNEKARWFLAVASMLGMGPDSAFGAGFVDLLYPLA